MSDLPHTLFVYGTLMAVAGHPLGIQLRAEATLIGAGSIQARLYVIDDPEEPGQNFYPGALPSPSPEDRVHGELFRLHDPATLLPVFDTYEACTQDWPDPHEFQLRAVPVLMGSGETVAAHSYLYTWDVSTARHVPSGRFTEFAPNTR